MSCKTCKKKTFKREQGELTAARITRVLPKKTFSEPDGSFEQQKVKVMCVANRQQSVTAQDEELKLCVCV